MKFGIVGNSQKENFSDAVSALLEKLGSSDIDYLIDEDIAEFLRETGAPVDLQKEAIIPQQSVFAKADIIIALGGDGTILRFSRQAAQQNKPILGVNLGKLGFLAEVSADELPDCIDEILRGEYLVSNRLTIACSLPGEEDEEIFGINDIVIDRGGLLRVIDVEIYVENDYLITFKGDGIIVSTPTGSTGYSLSCGGPIVAPDTDVLMITPVSPHTLNARPVIIPAEKTIRVVVSSPEPTVQLASDGQLHKLLSTPIELTFSRSSREIKLIKRKVRSFYDVLRSKLMWGRDIRIDTSEKLI